MFLSELSVSLIYKNTKQGENLQYKILIVEDDKTISNGLKNHLEEWGYNASCVTDFKTVITQFALFAPDIVLLDISLPFFGGYHWCSEIRKLSKLPIIFISSMSDNINIVMAMNMGADDFITKPFDLNVVTAKIGAQLRRCYDFAGAGHLLSSGDAVLNTNDATLHVGENTIELTKNEYKILNMLFEAKGNIISRDAIMSRLWETDSFIDDNTLTVNITRLRKKLETAGLFDLIKTKKGIGYIIEK